MPISTSLRKIGHSLQKPLLKRKRVASAKSFNRQRLLQRDANSVYQKALTRYVDARVGRVKVPSEERDRLDEVSLSASKKNEASKKSRKESFSDLALARKKLQRPLSKLELRAYELTRGLYKGDRVSFTSFRGNTYEGTFVGIGVIFDGKRGKIIPAIKYLEDGREERIRVDKIKSRK